MGGSGLIGAHVVDVLRERGHAATTVARSACAVGPAFSCTSIMIDSTSPGRCSRRAGALCTGHCGTASKGHRCVRSGDGCADRGRAATGSISAHAVRCRAPWQVVTEAKPSLAMNGPPTPTPWSVAVTSANPTGGRRARASSGWRTSCSTVAARSPASS
ncbi:hypothetical protein ACGFH8_17440 [Micromonospora sp. NPDC049175]|uniref:hypothetical protein n=1 Tax=Micromonospora sp. NPDC049175 TaxID=3364266 RepID=UPI0037218A33